MKPGQRAEFAVTASGDFPDERAVGALELDARELTSPVAIPVEVRTRRERGAIAVVAMLGLWFSAVSRNRQP